MKRKNKIKPEGVPYIFTKPSVSSRDQREVLSGLTPPSGYILGA